jgi:hypothetical protein
MNANSQFCDVADTVAKQFTLPTVTNYFCWGCEGGMDSTGSGYSSMAAFCEHGDEPVGFKTVRNFLTS